ncbi:tetratricopeptide repeat protein [Luedemannella flava]|uniref:Tetratricopeptide repeat protein n=1 Tax=Luedemannella flava TaxID=349316 RepID=A0ABP4XZV6_9ACTN
MKTQPATPSTKRPVKRATKRPAKPVELPFNGLVLGGILLLTAIIYANSLGNGFVDFDDPENVTGNMSIRDLTGTNLAHWFSTPLQYMYTPLVSLSYAIDWQFGADGPGMYHFTNLALHLGNVALVWALIRALTRKPLVTYLVTAAFALHPMNVDSIAWVSTRSNLLATLFSLGTLVLYLRYLRTGRWPALAGAVVLFACAGLSKSTAVMLPVIFFLIDYWYGRLPALHPKRIIRRWTRDDWLLLGAKAPFFAISLVLGLVALHFRMDTVVSGYNAGERVIMVCAALVSYLIALVAPVNLAFAHAYPDPDSLPWYLYAAPVVLIAVGWVLHRLSAPRKVFWFGAIFFLVNVVLSQTVLLIDNYKANRYVYLPYIGLFLILAYLVERAYQVAAERGLGWLRAGVTTVLVGSLLFWSAAVVVRNAAWKNTVTIMTSSIEADPNVAFTYNSRGIARYLAGDYDRAMVDFNKVLEVDPEFKLAVHYRSIIKYLKGDYQGALVDDDIVLAKYPGFASGFNERAKTKFMLNDFNGAYVDADMAIQIDPYLADAFNTRGKARVKLGDGAGAVTDLNTAIGFIPDFAEAFYQRGLAKQITGDVLGACADWRQVQTLNQAPFVTDATTALNSTCPAT